MLDELAKLDLSKKRTKKKIVADIDKIIGDEYKIVDINTEKPWGAFWRFDSSASEKFIANFFPGLSLVELALGVEDAELSPKFLLVEPNSRLSWQYHFRRAERWCNIAGPAGFYRSDDDEMGDLNNFASGDVVQLGCGERHRLVSGEGWSLIAEVWQHVDPENPSDEDDIVRLSDDYKR